MNWTIEARQPTMTSMLAGETKPICLRRVDPARNMARFYSLALQPTLFGGTSLVRAWGRIGTRGREKIETFDGDAQADLAFVRLERTKRNRGYR
ncbi:WGR domain-containing protein [Mesorhizobium sp.]|uniref:WGR domain-containing protein n=1 Tax=Mesorhizobium sp. TaxID=1871066 RepID=UPI0025D6D2D3|nr:WGR domain-containing protein [Mesorhizobium sp.]